MSTGIAHRRPRRRGIMLVEVLLALAITAMVATAVASLLFAVANGSRDRQDLRRHNVRADVLAARVDNAVRSSSMLLGHDPNCMVLWVADSRRNGKPDLSELRRIEWDAANKRLVCFEPAADLAPADDAAYALSEDFVAVTDALKGQPTFPGEVWANNVTGWTSTPAPGAVRDARTISYSVAVAGTAGTYTIPSAVSLRGTSVVER